jgi:hypothetical protein
LKEVKFGGRLSHTNRRDLLQASFRDSGILSAWNIQILRKVGSVLIKLSFPLARVCLNGLRLQRRWMVAFILWVNLL